MGQKSNLREDREPGDGCQTYASRVQAQRADSSRDESAALAAPEGRALLQIQAPDGLTPDGLAPDGLAPDGLAPDGGAPTYCFTNVTGTSTTALPPSGGENWDA